ncbi:MAG: hypothetical protein U5N56_00530 [Candidatus Marinimicrobia bacterium]|nr:hypothetical protein [Candidatus Neomarinimicrobiota bacterium]
MNIIIPEYQRLVRDIAVLRRKYGNDKRKKRNYTFTAAGNDGDGYVYALRKGMKADSMYVQKHRLQQLLLTPERSTHQYGRNTQIPCSCRK